jgi:AcrR family transcriptional regulator
VSPKPAYHHGNLRAALIQAGLDVIAEQGVRALTLREIGARSGVSRMAPYRHFANKEELLYAISEAGFTQFGDALEEARNSTAPDFPSRMTAMALAYVRFASEHQAYYQVMFPHQGSEPVRQGPAGARAFAVLEETVREGQLSGDVRPDPPVDIARLVWSTVHGISTLGLEKDPGPLTAFCARVLLDGLRPG